MAVSYDSSFPDTELVDPSDEQVTTKLIQFLHKRTQNRNVLQEHLREKQNNFRNVLVEIERENTSLWTENILLKTSNDQQKNIIFSLEGRIYNMERQLDSLLCKFNNANDSIREMQQELNDAKTKLKRCMIEKELITKKYRVEMDAETKRIDKELEVKLCKQRKQLERDDKLKLMKRVLVSNPESMLDNIKMKPLYTSSLKTSAAGAESHAISKKKHSAIVSDPHVSSTSSTISDIVNESNVDMELTKSRNIKNMELIQSNTKDNRIPVVNPRYRRSQSADRWIDHRPAGMVPVGTILQPQVSYKQNITKLTNPKTFAVRDVRYCLFAQQQDTDGELETKLYKADVLPTCSGGAQIVFNDVECLKQISPPN